jgi:prephenate dehydratase
VHQLIALPGTELSQIRRVCSHPQALAQCEQFLRKLPNVEIVATYDTAGSAQLIRDQKLTDTAAIASARAAEIFGLSVLQAAIQDYRDNITRFLLVARDPQALGTADKTSVVFALPNAPGALFKALSVFALRDIDMTKLESRPMRGRPWEYLFYVDLAAGRTDVRCGRALTHLAESAKWVKTLGSYARWNEASMKTLTAEAPVDVSAV